VLSALTLLVGMAAFLYSVYRLHRQMVAAKRRYVAWAHGLYASAYATVRSGDTLEGLRAQGSLLSAAEAMERRAESIHQWPFADRTFTWIATVATGVLVAIITRYVLREIGL
ncbi:MAG TPA: hypothetical protein VNT60_06915, partial [Deinococcales bacterium]|nr:hypothetical protein [Deinococcales bacterium]